MPENRLGMIVCGAFLGLVAAVVMAKMREPAPEPDKEVAAAESAATSPKETPASVKEPEPDSSAAHPTPSEISIPEPPPSAPPHTKVPAADLPSPIKLPEPSVALNDVHPAHSEEVTQTGVSLPAPANDKTPKPSPMDQGFPPPPPPPGPMLEPPPPPPPALIGADNPSEHPPMPPSGFNDKKGKDEDDKNKRKDYGKDDGELKKPEKPKNDKEAAPAPFSPQTNGSTAPLPGPAPTPFAPPPPDIKDNGPPKPPMKSEAPPPLPAPPPPDPAPIKVEQPLTPPEPPAPRQDKVTVVIPASPQPARVEPPPFVATPAARPIPTAPASNAPLVDSWDERTYVAKPGDTYAVISLSEYKTEDYAKALQMYNQNHPRAGDAMRRDGTMAPGDQIYLPPSPVLEKRHADVIVRSKPKPVTSGTVGGDGFGPVQADFRTPAEKPANPTYKVKVTGETLFQIASQQLHDGNRWSEIAALNPRAPTDGVVLGGTILQMPAGSATAAPPVPRP